MNEQTPRDPQQPIDANDPTPQQPAAQPTDTSAHTTQQPIANPAADQATPKRGRGILKPVLIGAGAAVAVLAVVGVGVGIADAIDDGDDQPQAGVTAPATTDGTSVPGQSQGSGEGSGDGSGDDQGGQQPAGPGNGASTEPSAFVDAIDAAVAAADGEGATSVEVERDGWKVDVALADGTEVEVRVFADDRAPIVQADDDDRTSDQLLDTSRIADIVDAAIAAAGGGVVETIETDTDDDHAFDVQVDLGGDRDVDVELADDLTVVSVDD